MGNPEKRTVAEADASRDTEETEASKKLRVSVERYERKKQEGTPATPPPPAPPPSSHPPAPSASFMSPPFSSPGVTADPSVVDDVPSQLSKPEHSFRTGAGSSYHIYMVPY